MKARAAVPEWKAMALPLAALLLSNAPEGSAEPVDDCATLPICLERLKRAGPSTDALPVERRLVSFGDAAVHALVAMLADPDPKVRDVAGMALTDFDAIDPRHLPALISAYERDGAPGSGRFGWWLPLPIAATGADAALAFLQAEFLENPDENTNAQVPIALARFGERLRPFMLAALEGCRTGDDAVKCGGLMKVLAHFKPGFPEWAVAPLAAIARSPAASTEVRDIAGRVAIGRLHPIGLEILRERLESMRKAPPRGSWEIAQAIRDVARYGPAAATAGPAVATFLASAAPDVSAEAALALGAIRSPVGAAEMIRLEPAFMDDWLLAYNVVEGLGRMGAAQARPLLERTAKTHWHKAVRNNAERALSAIAGGPFARPGIAGDAASDGINLGADGDALNFGYLRYDGDRSPTDWCGAQAVGEPIPFPQDPPGRIRWPDQGARSLSFTPMSEAQEAALRERHPGLPNSRGYAFRVPLRSGFLVGHERSGYGGGLLHVRSNGGGIEELAEDDARYAFWMGGRLYVVQGSGLAETLLSSGTLITVDGDPPRAVRHIRLPAGALRVSVTDRRAIVIETSEGDVAIREDGRLVDPETLGSCREPEK